MKEYKYQTNALCSFLYIPQITFRFSDTACQNLLLGNTENLSDEQIMQVLEACDCGFVSSLPLGLDTMLEEDGANLSGGQRQRLAIAHALLLSPKNLVLDEATSNMDTVSEQKILGSLHTLYPDMTVIMIAHRLNGIRYFDQIMVLNNGFLAECGTHTDLTERNGIYASLFNSM